MAKCLRTSCLCVFAWIMGVAGCASPFVSNYQPVMLGQHFNPVVRVAVINVGEKEPDLVRRTLSPDSVLVGRSRFVSTRADTHGVEDFARKIGANLVLIQRRFQRLVHREGYTTVTNTDTTDFSVRSESGKELHGTATTHHQQTVPYAYTEALYWQEALYLRAATLPTQAQVSWALLWGGEADE